MQLNLNKKNKKILFFFSITSITSSILLFLTFNGYWSLTHGPLYFFIGDALNSYGELSSTIYAEPSDTDIYTFQIGIAFLHFLSIFLLDNKWFLLYLFIISTIWSIVLLKINILLKYYGLNNIDSIIISLLIFFQPYNINQIANFSNESIYFPLLIFFFFYSLSLVDKKIKYILSREKIFLLFFLIFLLFGSFFRLHHLVFFGSFIFFYLVSKRYDLFLLFSVFLIITIVTKYLLIVNSNLEGSISTITGFLDVLKEVYIEKKASNVLPSDHFIEKDIFLNNVLNATSNFSFYLYINKFINQIYLAIVISTIFGLIPIISIFQNLRNKLKNFSILSLIFLVFSSVFIFILPMFEYSYLLPSTFLIIIFNYILLKKVFKEYFYHIVSYSIILITLFLVTVFSGIYKFENIEVYRYRSYVEGIIKFSEKINRESSLVYFNEKSPSMPEIYRWYIDFPICNFNLSYKKCSDLREIDKINNIYVIVTEDPKNAKLNKKFLTSNFDLRNTVVDTDALQKYFVLNEKKK